MFVLRFGTRSEGGCVAPLLATCIWFRKRTTATLGATWILGPSTEHKERKKKGNFRYRVPSEYLAVPSDAFLEFYGFDAELRFDMRKQERAAGVVACRAARLAGRYQRSSRC